MQALFMLIYASYVSGFFGLLCLRLYASSVYASFIHLDLCKLCFRDYESYVSALFILIYASYVSRFLGYYVSKTMKIRFF